MDRLQNDLKETTELSRKLDTTLSEHSDTISDHSAQLGAESTKTQSIQKELLSIYRDINSLENLKMDRNTCSN
jgi:chromosome segregation ATPase